MELALHHASEIYGTTPEEIADLEVNVGKRLPSRYREFLLGIGRGAGRFLNGRDIFLAALRGLREEAIGLLKENKEEVELQDDAYVFSMHQGYEFTYFNFSEGDDPPVYQYVEGNGPPTLAWNSFSDFLKEAISQYAQLSPHNK